jgi:hypothetical protein
MKKKKFAKNLSLTKSMITRNLHYNSTEKLFTKTFKEDTHNSMMPHELKASTRLIKSINL